MKQQSRKFAAMMIAVLILSSATLLAQQGSTNTQAPKATTPQPQSTAPTGAKPTTPPPYGGPVVKPGMTPQNQADYISRNVDARVDKLKTDLNLTDAQAAKLKEAFTKEANDMKAVNEESMAQMQATNAKRRDIQLASQAALDSTLTAEQKAKQEELRKQQMEEMQKRRAGMPGFPGGYGKQPNGATPAAGQTPPANPNTQTKPTTPPPAAAPKGPGL